MEIENIKKIKNLRENGLSFNAIALTLGISKNQARYYANFYDLDAINIKLENEKNICEIIKTSNSISDTCKKINQKPTNTNIEMIKKIINKYNIDTHHFNTIKTNKNKTKLKLQEILIKNSTYNTSKLQHRLIQEGLKEHKCECCGNTLWNNEPIPLQLHHKNGSRTDNRIENLQLLCPNCHAQTDNYCGKNIKNKLPKRKNKCKYCGKEFESKYPKVFCCKEHRKEYEKEHRPSKCPSKEELIQAFKVCKTFTQVGKYYGVSDKAIFKWCAKVGLPTKIKQIKEYIDNN